MPGLGQSDPPSVPPGAEDIARLQAARREDGTPAFSPQDIMKYKRDTTQKLLGAGFTVQQVDAHWGDNPDPRAPALEQHVQHNLAKAGPGVVTANDPWTAFVVGYGQSPAGLAQGIGKGIDPNKIMAAQVKPGWVNHLANMAGSAAGSLATDFLGMAGGAAAGAAVPGLGETGASEVAGAVGGAFGAGFTTQATRELILDAYNHGQIHNTNDLIGVLAGSVKRSLTAGVESAPFGIAGPIASGIVARGGGKLVAAGAGGAAGITAAVGTAAAIDQKVPNASDFAGAAIMMVTLHGVSKSYEVVKGVVRPGPAALHVQSNLEEIYRRNGTPPWDVLNRARTDPAIRQEILQQDVNGNSVAPRIHASAPPEPAPHVAPSEPDFGTMKRVGPAAPKPAPIVSGFEDLSTALEGSRDDSVSPAGAIGKHQIMIGTARQYGFGSGMSDGELVQRLHDPEFNAQVFHRIAADLHARFHGDMNAMLIAYNAGPGRAGEYMTKGPGTELEAIPDKHARGGIRYESRPSARDESWLPMETQKYLANGRRRSGGTTADEGGESGPPQGKDIIPSWEEKGPSEAERELTAGGGGGGSLPPEGPLGVGAPDSGRGPGGKKYGFDEAVDEIMSNIGEPPKPPSLLNPDRLMEQYVSELTPARNIDTSLIREGKLNRTRDVGQEDMFRQTYASDTRTGAFIRFGPVRIGDNRMEIDHDGASGMKAVGAVKEAGGNMRAWVASMLAKRTVDKAKQGVDTGFNPEAAEALANDWRTRKYEKATQIWSDVGKGVLEYGRDSQMFSQAQVDNMMRLNPAWISMRRVMGDDASFGGGAGGKFRARDPLKNMEGSDRQIIDPIAASIDNWRLTVAMADRNRAIGSIIGQIEMGRLKDLGLVKLKWDPKETMAEPGSDVFKPYIMNPEDIPEAQEAFAPLLAERASKGFAPNEFVYYRNGVAEKWSAKDPALARLMRTTTSPKEADIIGVALNKIAQLDRAGVVLDPAFPTRVTLRHQITAFIGDPLHPPPFVTWAGGMMDVLTKSGVYKDWVANGGAAATLADMDRDWLQHDMENVFEDQGINARIWNRVKHPLEAYQWMSERMDAASRVGYYKMATDRGISPLKAATMSRKAYLDYAERAALDTVNSLSRKVPFLRPKILGMKMFMENFADRPAETALYSGAAMLGLTAATVTLPMMALYAWNAAADKDLPEEEKFSSIPRWIRDTHYIAPPIAGARVMFPLPFVVGVPFGGMVNRFMDHFAKSDPHAFDDWFASMTSDYNPMGLMPTALKVPIESTANYNFNTGKPIVPGSIQAADGYMQYTNATTEPSKAIARLLGPPGANIANFSPIQFEHWVQGWTGPVGMGILRAVNGRMTDYKPPFQMADIPIVGTFFVRHPQMHAQQIEDFFTDINAMKTAHEDWSLALAHGDKGEIATAAQGPWWGLRVVGGIENQLHVMGASVVAINNDKTMPPAEKSQHTDQIINKMIEVSIRGSGIVALMQGKDPGEAFDKLPDAARFRQQITTARQSVQQSMQTSLPQIQQSGQARQAALEQAGTSGQLTQ